MKINGEIDLDNLPIGTKIVDAFGHHVIDERNHVEGKGAFYRAHLVEDHIDAGTPTTPDGFRYSITLPNGDTQEWKEPPFRYLPWGKGFSFSGDVLEHLSQYMGWSSNG